jgi:hypothetical protein
MRVQRHMTRSPIGWSGRILKVAFAETPKRTFTGTRHLYFAIVPIRQHTPGIAFDAQPPQGSFGMSIAGQNAVLTLLPPLRIYFEQRTSSEQPGAGSGQYATPQDRTGTASQPFAAVRAPIASGALWCVAGISAGLAQGSEINSVSADGSDQNGTPTRRLTASLRSDALGRRDQRQVQITKNLARGYASAGVGSIGRCQGAGSYYGLLMSSRRSQDQPRYASTSALPERAQLTL